MSTTLTDADRIELARRSAEAALWKAQHEASTLLAHRLVMREVETKVERAADLARLYCQALAEVEPSAAVERASASLLVTPGVPWAELLAVIGVPETIRPDAAAAPVEICS